MVGSPIPSGVMGRWAGLLHSMRLPWYWQYQASYIRNLGSATSEQRTVVPRGPAVSLVTVAPFSQTGGGLGSPGNFFESLGSFLGGTSLGSILLPPLGPSCSPPWDPCSSPKELLLCWLLPSWEGRSEAASLRYWRGNQSPESVVPLLASGLTRISLWSTCKLTPPAPRT